MKLKMTGHDKTTVKYVSVGELKKVSGGNSKGYFDSDIEWNDGGDPITVTIKNTTYINKDLPDNEKKDVKEHEDVHFADFKGLAAAMKRDIEQALKQGRDAEMQARIDWLIYDRCVKTATFHRKTAGYSVEICSKPDSKRPV